MGTVFYCTKPSEEFVGTWSNPPNESLTIYPSGIINYIKKLNQCTIRYRNCPAHFENNEFQYCCCVCCSLHGTLDYGGSSTARLIVNGNVFTKEPVSAYMKPHSKE